MKTFTVLRNEQSAIKFSGEEVAFTKSSPDQATGSNYSGSVGHWTELTLYRTAKGKYVCERVERTQWQGAKDEYYGQVCETLEEVIKFFGHGWVAQDLYHNAGIEDVIEVE